MRLIDADMLLKNLEWLEDYDHYVLHDVKISMDETPTVKAIPIEFIKEQIDKTTDINNRDELDVLYAGNLGYLLKLWEKENEKDI